MGIWKLNAFCLFIYSSALSLSWCTWDLWSSPRHVGLLVVAGRFFSCGMQTLSCSPWDLVPWLGIEPWPTPLGAWSLSPWTTKEVPGSWVLKGSIDCISSLSPSLPLIFFSLSLMIFALGMQTLYSEEVPATCRGRVWLLRLAAPDWSSADSPHQLSDLWMSRSLDNSSPKSLSFLTKASDRQSIPIVLWVV